MTFQEQQRRQSIFSKQKATCQNKKPIFPVLHQEAGVYLKSGKDQGINIRVHAKTCIQFKKEKKKSQCFQFQHRSVNPNGVI